MWSNYPRNRVLYIGIFSLSNFFLLTLLTQLLSFVGVDLYIGQLMRVSFAITGVYCLTHIKCKPFDVLILIYLLYILINGLGIGYLHHWSYFYRAMLTQYLPIFCYFIGRYSLIDIDCFLNRMKWPLLFAMLCGIYFYITEPGWYVLLKDAQLNANDNDYRISGIYRLSSFWGHPYVIAYSTLLYSLYLTHKLIKGIHNKIERVTSLALLSICCIVLVLAGMRVTILFYIVALVYFVIWKKGKSDKILRVFLISLFLIALFFTFITIGESSYFNEHMKDLFEEDALSNRFRHTAGNISSYSFLGDGLGRYDYLAREFGKWAIVDNEFQNHIAELGYFGASLLILMLLFTTFRCYKNKWLFVENSVVFFFVSAMIGASVLSNPHQFNYIFWYTLGLLWSDKYIICKRRKV